MYIFVSNIMKFENDPFTINIDRMNTTVCSIVCNYVIKCCVVFYLL